MSLKNRDEAASGVVAFIVAGFVFVGSVGAVLYLSEDVDGPAIDDGTTSASLERQAGSLIDLLLGSQGLSAEGSNWVANKTAAEALVRLGLMDPAHPGYLDFAKFQNLRLAPLEEDADGDGVPGETALGQNGGTVDDDGYVNYVEATAAMGLNDAGLDFHIRSYPNLKAVRELLGEGIKDENLRVAYIGDILAANGNSGNTDITVSPISCSSTDRNNAYYLSVTVTIPSGASTTSQYEGVLDADLGGQGGSGVTRKMNSFAVTPGASTTFHGSVPFGPGRSCSGAAASFDLYDVASGRLVQGASQTLTGGTGSSSAQTGILVDTLQENYNASTVIGFSYDGEGLATGQALFLTVCANDISNGPCGSPTATISFTAKSGNGNNNKREVFLTSSSQEPDGKLPVGDYTVRLYLGSSANSTFTRAEERLLVVASPPPAYVGPTPPPPGAPTYTFGAAVKPEVGFLEDLVEKFCPTLFDESTARDPLLPLTEWSSSPHAVRCPTTFKSDPMPLLPGCAQAPYQPGDVFPQARNNLKDDLKARLLCNPSDQNSTGRYDITNTLIVGSNVDHQMLTSNQVKDTIATWVEGGGTLIVFGSADQRLEWLQSVFHIATSETSSNGISVPDSSHPVLHTGDDLAYNEYDNHNKTWSFKQNGANAEVEGFFTHVVLGDNGDPVLTISDPGAFGKGTVILTTWLPYDLMNDGAPYATGCNAANPDQGCLFMNNVLMQGYRDLFLDYGPVIPSSDHEVIPAVRKAQICYPPFDPDENDADTCPPEARISLDVIVYVF